MVDDRRVPLPPHGIPPNCATSGSLPLRSIRAWKQVRGPYGVVTVAYHGLGRPNAAATALGEQELADVGPAIGQ
jgi:hypothetical protein